MKKGLIVLTTMLITLIGMINVKADTTYYQLNMRNYNYNDFSRIKYNNQDLKSYFTSIFNNQTNYNYYIIYLDYYTFNPENPKIYFSMFNSTEFGTSHSDSQFSYSLGINVTGKQYIYNNGTMEENNYGDFSFEIYTGYYYSLIDSNYKFKAIDNYSIIGIMEEPIDIKTGSIIPTLYNIENPSGYTEVNLDNYEYVLLTLKNYNQKKAFSTNLQVKGQIGITPIYNYGQTSKDSITGSQVQDRCNVTYENYTNYPFYIIQTDLQNNVIYAVKECSNNSSFKFDNTIFDITYITAENKDNPTVTINGKTYNVIPYNDLPSTATKNEKDNYIPGQSGQANSTGGLDSAIKGTQQKMSEIWNTFTYFTDFINQIFSVFPNEVKTILLSAFTIMIVIGLIKIFIN